MGGLSGGAPWPCRSVFWAVWSPFTWLVGYRDPRKPDLDILHGERPQTACRSVMRRSRVFLGTFPRAFRDRNPTSLVSFRSALSTRPHAIKRG